MRLAVFLAGTTVLGASLAAPASAGVQAPATISDSYHRARALLDRAIEAHGGLTALQAAGTLRVRMEGTDHWRNQSRRVEPPYDAEPWTGDLWLDLGRNRMVWTATSRFPGGFVNASRAVLDGNQGFNANLRQGTHVPVPNRTLDSQRGILFRLPHLVLLAARDQAAGLRWLGPMTLSSGAPVEVIATAVPPAQLTLGIDPRTGELRALLGVQADPLAGDAATETEFTGYRRIGGILVPARRIARVAGEVLQESRYVELVPGAAAPDSLLRPPPGSAELQMPAPGDPVRELAPGVWAVNSSGYWSLVVAFEDHVLVVEAPGNGVPATIARVRELAPGKPIRYVAPSHHHDDHAGGMRHYVAAGATVLTTPGNREYFTRMAEAHSTLRPDRQNEVRAPIRIETIEGGRRVLGDGRRTVELHDIGPSPHANEMLVAWLPAEGILFQGDLLNLGGDGRIYPSTANATTEHFAQWVRRQGWAVRVLAGVHMAPGTLSQLDEAIAKRAPAP